MKSAIKKYWNSSTYREKFFDLGFALFVASLPFSNNLNTIALWIFIASSLVSFPISDRIEALKKNRYTFFALFLLYFLYVAGIFYSSGTHDAFRGLERTLPLLIIPLIILTHKREHFKKKLLFLSLGLGLFLGMLICWTTVIISIVTNRTPWVQAKYFFEWIYTDWNLVKPLDIHPSYFAILLVIFLLGIYRDPTFIHFRKKKTRLFLLSAPYFLFLIETNSRIGVISLILIFIITLLRKINFKSAMYSMGLVLTVVLLSIQFDYLGNKFLNIMDAEGNIKLERYLRWKEILPLFYEEGNWLWGVGTGDVQPLLNKAYKNGGFSLALNEKYNAHNQYLQFLLSNGIFGLLIYIGALCYFFKKTNAKGEALTFLVIIILFSLTETIFGRSKGVFIFAFFYSLYSILYAQKYKLKK